MSYTKIANTLTNVEETISAVLTQYGVSGSLASDLIAAASMVQLETGDEVWVSCVLHDRVETPQTDFITVALAVQNGSPNTKANGQYLACVFWHGAFPELIADQGVSAIRKALMMIALGETQPTMGQVQADGTTVQVPVVQLPDEASRCIRTYISAAAELSAPLEDVL